MGLGFGFFLDFPGKKLSLKTQGYFCYCWSVLAQSPSLSCSSPHPISGEAGGSQEAGRGHSRNSWPQLIPDIFLSIWHHVQHIELGEEGRRGILRMMVFVFPSYHQRRQGQAFLGMTQHLPAHRKWWKNSSFCFSCVWLLLYLLHCLCLNPWVFSLDSLSHPADGAVSKLLCRA